MAHPAFSQPGETLCEELGLIGNPFISTLVVAMNIRLFLLATLIALPHPATGQEGKTGDWIVDGVKRQAIIKPPARKSTGPVPVIFGFHGHCGNMQNYARKDFQKYWPEAIIVSPQGLPTPGIISDPQGLRAGWQNTIGGQIDRDLNFVDAILKTLHEEYQIDDNRIYVTGHSNGGGFTYLLLAARPKVFAAYAPSAAGSPALRTTSDLKPAPVFHLAGEKDNVVSFEMQKRTMAAIRKLNQCSDDGKDWAPKCKLYSSKINAPFVSYIHGGDHTYPNEANELIVKFFKENARK